MGSSTNVTNFQRCLNLNHMSTIILNNQPVHHRSVRVSLYKRDTKTSTSTFVMQSDCPLPQTYVQLLAAVCRGG